MVDAPRRLDGESPGIPAGATEDVDEVATARDAAAESRDRRAEERDEIANVRDAEADARDWASETSDAWDRSEGAIGPHFGRPKSGADPTDGGAAVEAGVSDRTLASWDRKGAQGDRAEAAGDRQAASADRCASASDRIAAGLDELTGAHRRGAGFVELQREMARARRAQQHLVLAFIDVDGLKAINDSRGHTAGDRVLQEVVATLRAKLRPYDLIVRFGGDEFLCAIPGVSMGESVERLAAVNIALAHSPEPGSVTVGLADMQVNDSFQDLIGRADAALYQQRQQDAVIDLTVRSQSTQASSRTGPRTLGTPEADNQGASVAGLRRPTRAPGAVEQSGSSGSP